MVWCWSDHSDLLVSGYPVCKPKKLSPTLDMDMLCWALVKWVCTGLAASWLQIALLCLLCLVLRALVFLTYARPHRHLRWYDMDVSSYLLFIWAWRSLWPGNVHWVCATHIGPTRFLHVHNLCFQCENVCLSLLSLLRIYSAMRKYIFLRGMLI